MIHRTNFFVSQDAALRWYGALDDPAIAVRDKIASIGAANGARSRPEWRGVGTVASRCALFVPASNRERVNSWLFQKSCHPDGIYFYVRLTQIKQPRRLRAVGCPYGLES
jgi:hypothetical protein